MPDTTNFAEWSRASEIESVFEDFCPTAVGDRPCGTTLKMTHIGGLPAHSEDFTIPEGLTYLEWTESDIPYSNVMGIEFTCEAGHVHWIEKTAFGDWS